MGDLYERALAFAIEAKGGDFAKVWRAEKRALVPLLMRKR